MIQIAKGEYLISTDEAALQFDVIHGYLSGESYWAQQLTPEQMRKAIAHSICFGVYRKERQIGFARVVSDHATFAYIGDVFIIEEFRGQGLSKWLMKTIIGHPELQWLRRWLLATRDAHKLYEQFGFVGLSHPQRWMEHTAPDAY